MEWLINIIGSIVVVCACVSLAGFSLWLAFRAFREIDWHLGRMVFKSKERREICLEPADALIRDALLRGHKPFTPGSLEYQRRYEFLKRTTGTKYPDGYVTIDEEKTRPA